MFEPEEARLAAICGRHDQRDPACIHANLRPSRVRVSPFWARPNAPEPLGYFVLRVAVQPETPTQLAAALDVEWASRPGEYQEWIRDLGDWGYGYHLDGWGVQAGNWVQLLGPKPLRSVWLPAVGKDLRVDVSPLQGTVSRLRDIRAAPVAGGRRTQVAGDYTIVEVRGDQVRFRTEIPSDMPCDDEPDPPVPPPLWTAPVSSFFDHDGTPRFDVAYGKGC